MAALTPHATDAIPAMTATSVDSVLAADLTWTDVKDRLDRGCTVAVFPIGSCEQHGPHLPLGSDTYFIYEASRRGAALAQERAGGPVGLVFPPLWYSNGDHWAPGEVWLRPTTIITVICDVVEQLERSGFKHIVLTTGHGGNPATMADGIREARRNGVKAQLYASSPWAFMDQAMLKEIAETKKTGHACELETSTSLHVFGDRVRLERLQPRPEQPNYWAELSPYDAVRRGTVRQQGVMEGKLGTEHLGYVGDPTKASAEKGKRMTDSWAEGFANFLLKLHQPGG